MGSATTATGKRIGRFVGIEASIDLREPCLSIDLQPLWEVGGEGILAWLDVFQPFDGERVVFR